MVKKSIKIKSKLKRHKKKFSSKKVELLIILIILLLGGYFLYRSIIINTIAPVQIAEIKNSTGTVNLNLQASKTELAPNEETTISVNYDSPTNKMTVISGEITYDPNLLTPSNFVRGSDFPTELIAASASNGKITFTYGVAVAAGSGLTGQGNILTFTVKAKQVGSANLNFGDATDVRVVSVDTNALREIHNTTLTITNPNADSSPSTSPSANPTASPSTNPSTYPSISPSTTPSSSPVSSPTSSPVVNKPASPTNLRYNCYNNGTRITLRWDEVAGATSYTLTLDQKDGDNDQNTTSTRTEKDLEIKSNTTYTWKVAANKDSVSGDSTTVADIKCSGDNTSVTPKPSPTPNPTFTPTPAPTKKSLSQTVSNIFKPKSPSPTPSPIPSLKSSPVPLASFVPSSPISSPGSLSDIFASPTPTLTSTKITNTPSIISKIFLGWQALFIKLVESLTK